ncbi:MAG TPA: sigma-70 family RNA polymerase sigma factor [Kofleriaceae bacterium]
MLAAAVLPRREPLDQLTLRRAQQGDERAWRVLVETHQHAIHALIWRLLAKRSRHRCEDLTQETFVRVLRALSTFDPAGSATLQTWMLTIATRLTLNELRRPEPYALPDDLDAPASERADASAERKRLGEAIAAGVAALPDAQRAVFVLREYHELDYAEIATALEIDLGTVKSRLARARAALRDSLAAALPELGARHG